MVVSVVEMLWCMTDNVMAVAGRTSTAVEALLALWPAVRHRWVEYAQWSMSRRTYAGGCMMPTKGVVEEVVAGGERASEVRRVKRATENEAKAQRRAHSFVTTTSDVIASRTLCN
jgi:hypothetical protein